METTEEYLPSAKAALEKGHKCPFNPTAQTAKNVGTVIQCEDCGKWRCMHAQKKLSKKQRDELEVLLETILFSCGSNLSVGDEDEEDDENNITSVIQNVHVRANLSCRSDIEFTYYSAGFELICIHCGAEDDLLEKEGYYPQCQDCVELKRGAIARRGKNSNQK